jgi:hypothetical protein
LVPTIMRSYWSGEVHSLEYYPLKEDAMQGPRSPQEHETQMHGGELPAMPEDSVQDATTPPALMTRLLAKVPQLSLLATAFYAAAPLLVDPSAMGGHKHA